LREFITQVKQIINPGTFQKIQDDTAEATGLAIITVDYQGTPVTVHSKCSEFCRKMRGSPEFAALCRKCDSRGGLEAARNHEPYIYLCHAGIVDLAIPIILDDLYIGAFMAGQVLLDDPRDNRMLERMLEGSGAVSDYGSDPKLGASYQKLPYMSLQRVRALANMMLHIGNYFVENALLKGKAGFAAVGETQAGFDASGQDKPKYGSAEAYAKKTRGILDPALDYINGNPSEKISLAHMAALCNISPSYFSKLFAKENLGSLSSYVNGVKLTSAKELLQSTNWPIRSVADYLGYDDCGYFIKIFKKQNGVTPTQYRRFS
jgi:ligand-binding sensor protein/AraC-like DNA-binding protein